MFSSRLRELTLVLLVSLTGVGSPFLALSANESISPEALRIPRIKQVAIMPVYWQSQAPGENAARIKQTIDKSFSPLARSSKRFYFPNDEITAELWANPDGRKELADNYEIDAFLNLTAKFDNDLLHLTVRFMNPDLQNYLVESERIPFSWAASASEEDLQQRLKLLVFRTLNRYPVDVFITSIQGSFITLSGGTQQLIFEGDELDFYQTSIKARHPVDGSWLAFDKKRLGKAKIISTHEQSSIAKLTSLVYEDAIKIGDGAIIPASATRRAFDKPKEEPTAYKQIASSPIVTVEGGPEPSLPLPPPTPVPKVPKAPTTPLPKPTPKTVELEPTKPAPKLEEPQKERLPQQQEESKSAEEPTSEPLEDTTYSPPPAQTGSSYVQVVATSDSFTYSGAALAQSQTGSLFLNNFRARSSMPLDADVEVFGEIGFGFGSTAKGDYSGFALAAEPLYNVAAFQGLVPSIDRLLVGSQIRYESLGVTKQTFGGWDIFTVSPSAHLQSAVALPQEKVTLDFDFNLKFSLLTSGTAGIKGTKKDLDNLSITEWELRGAMRAAPRDIEWGGILGSRAGSAKAGTKTLNYENLGFGLTARILF